MVKKKTGKAPKAKKPGVQLTDHDVAEEKFKSAPHTFVFSRGNVGKNVTHLIRDVRKVMEPYTASSLKARRNNVLKDFVSVAGMLHVTNFITFTKTETTINMRIMRLPRGPTLTFRLHSYCLAKDIVSSLKRPNVEEKQFAHSPLLVMNNFAGEGMHFKLMTSMFQNMFPSINVNKAKLKEIKRCLLMTYNDEDKTIDVRHYNIKAVPAGTSRGVKKLLKSKVPNMGKYETFEEYMTRGGDASESEAEQDGPENVVVLPQHMPGKGNVAAAKSAIRLTEMGPRLKLQLIKIEEGICQGEVLYHEFIHKTEEQLEEQKAMREKKSQLRAQRKKLQQDNLQRKAAEKEENKKRALKGMKQKELSDEEATVKSDEDDDVEYFKEAVGENPDPELFNGKNTKRKSSHSYKMPVKRKKFSKDSGVPIKSGEKPNWKNQQKGQKKPMDSFKKTGKGKSFNNKGAGKKNTRKQPGRQRQRKKK